MVATYIWYIVTVQINTSIIDHCITYGTNLYQRLASVLLSFERNVDAGWIEVKEELYKNCFFFWMSVKYDRKIIPELLKEKTIDGESWKSKDLNNSLVWQNWVITTRCCNASIANILFISFFKSVRRTCWNVILD